MAHALTKREDGTYEMFYAADSGVPWHKLGTSVEKAVTSEEAIVLAQMDWEVKLGAMRLSVSNTRVPDFRAIYRDDNNHVLGIVREGYKPFQNRDAFAFIDSLVEDRVVHYETAGTLFGGKRIWVLAQLDEDMEINGEQYKGYMLLTSSHDGQRAIRVQPTSVRVVCNNTLTAALHGRERFVRVPHSKRLSDQIAVAKAALSITTGANKRLRELLEIAAKVELNKTQFEGVRTELFGSLDDDTPTVRRKAIEAFGEIYAAEAAQNGETAYSLINAITGYADHARSYRGDSETRAEARFASLTEGSGVKLKSHGISALLTAVPDFAAAANKRAAELGLATLN